MSRNLHRLLVSQTDRALRQLSRFDSDPETSVHQARVSLKRCRTLLRLLRQVTGKRVMRRLNAAYRAVALNLSSQRDNHARSQVMDKYLQRPALATTPSLADLRYLQENNRAVVSAARSELQSILHRVGTIHPAGGFSRIRDSVVQLLTREKRAYQHAMSAMQDDDFHQWRKSSKHLYYLVCIMRPVDLEALPGLKNRLSDYENP